MKNMLTKILLLIVLLISSEYYSQTSIYTPPEIIKTDPELLVFIREKYNESHKEYCEDCSYSEKQVVNSYLFKRKLNTIAMLEHGDFILSGTLFDFVNDVYKKIAASNPSLTKKKIILLKNETPNAFTMGQDIIFIHTGLLYRLQNEDQFAFILCHELGHDELNHNILKIRSYAKDATNKDQEKKIKGIIAKKYGMVTALNELLVPGLLENRKKSREYEFAADSLGMILFQKSGFNLEKGCTSLDIFIDADHVRDTLELNFTKELSLTSELIDLKKLSNYSNESSLGDFEEDAGLTQDEINEQNNLNDLLRTHPFEVERSEKLYQYLNLKIPENFNTTISEEYKNIRYLAEGEMISNALLNQQVGKALFYSMNMERNYPNDSYSKLATTFSMLYLYYLKSHFKEGIALENQDEDNDVAYDKLIFFLKKLSPKECYHIGKNLFDQYPFSTKTLESKVIKLIIYSAEEKNEEFKTYYKENEDYFKTTIYWNFVNSMNMEVIKRISKK